MKFRKHVFVCTNQKEAPKRSCSHAHGLALVDAFKLELKNRGLNVEVRAQPAGCLDTCGLGPSVVVYPEGIYYGNVQVEDVAEIVDSHLAHDVPVERLKLNF